MLAFVLVGLAILGIGFIIIQRTAMGPDINNGIAEGGMVAKILGKWAHKQFREYRPEAMKVGYLLGGAQFIVALAAIFTSFTGKPGTSFSTPFWASAIVAVAATVSAVLIILTIRKPKGKESLFALMGVSASATIVVGVITLVISAAANSSPLGFLALLTLGGGVILAWTYAMLLVQIGVKIADLAEGMINTGASFLRLLANAFDKEKLASMIKDANPFNEDAYLEKTNRFFRPLLSAASAIALANALFPDELHLAALMAASAYSEVNCFRYEALGGDVTNRRRRSVVLFDGWTFILLSNYILQLVFLKYSSVQTAYWHPVVNAMKTISMAVIENVFWLVAAFACALAVKFLPRLFDAESKRLRWVTQAIGGLMLFTFLGIFAWNVVQRPLEEKATALGVGAWKAFTPRLEVTKTPSVNVNWTGAGPDRKTESYIVERRESTEPGFTRVEKLVAGTTTWEDRKVTRGKTYLYRVIIVEGSEEITSAEQRITIPEEPTAKKPEAKTKTAARSQAVPDTEPQSPAECPNGSCGQNAPLDELCRRHPAACQ